MNHKLRVLALLVMVVLPVASYGFFTELKSLESELISWQGSHSGDFSDLLETLGKMSSPFTDVEDTEWFHPYVTSLASWGLVSGTKNTSGKPTGRFEPARSVTLAEMLKIAFEAAEVHEEECVNPKLSQAQDHWARAYVGCAEEYFLSVMDRSGVDLNVPVTRAEAISIVSDVFQDPLVPISSEFQDTVGHPLERYVANAAALKIVSGDRGKDGLSLGTFRPNDPVSRAEAAKIVFSRLKIEAKKILLSQK